MALETVIASSLAAPERKVRALVLMGGGARTAYQVGVLRAMASMLLQQNAAPDASGFATTAAFPFEVLVGTSAGALNVASLAGYAELGLGAFDELARFWMSVRSNDVYQLNKTSGSAWFASRNKYLAALNLSRGVLAHGAILDNAPLSETLRRAVSLDGIDRALAARAISAVAVTASSYSSGVHWTFCQRSAKADVIEPWIRPGRRATFQDISFEHLIASSAIPFVFPASPLVVDGQREFFGDGSMRQISPLSPALHLGAHDILVIGVGQPTRSGLAADAPSQSAPGVSAVAAHAMASVFHDTLQADVEQAMRVSETLRRLPPSVAAVLPYRPVRVLAMQPSQSLDALALQYASCIPKSTRSALGGLLSENGGASLASYLLFEPDFVNALIALGQRDAYSRAAELLGFFAHQD